MEAMKFQDLSSVSQRLRKNSDVVQSESKGLRTLGTSDEHSGQELKAKNQEFQGQEPVQGPGSQSQAESAKCVLSLFLIHLGPQQAELCSPTWGLPWWC